MTLIHMGVDWETDADSLFLFRGYCEHSDQEVLLEAAVKKASFSQMWTSSFSLLVLELCS